METWQFNKKDQITVIGDSLDNYLKDKPTDCVLYAKDGSKFKIHRIVCAKEQCCEILEVFGTTKTSLPWSDLKSRAGMFV